LAYTAELFKISLKISLPVLIIPGIIFLINKFSIININTVDD